MHRQPATVDGDSSSEREKEAARTLERMQNLAVQDVAIKEIDAELNLTEEEIKARMNQQQSKATSGSKTKENEAKKELEAQDVPFTGDHNEDHAQDEVQEETLPQRSFKNPLL